MRKPRYRREDGYDIAGRWFIGIGLTVVLLLLLSLFVDGCVTQRVEIKVDSPDSSNTELGPKLEINSED